MMPWPPPINWEWTPASVVALYAAVVGTLALAVSAVQVYWNIHIGRRDNADVRLTVQYVVADRDLRRYWVPMGSLPGEAISKPHTYLSWSIVNKGRRGVTIHEFGFSVEGGRKLAFKPLMSNDLPAEVGEGKSKPLLVDAEVLKQDTRRQLIKPPKWGYVRDATGKHHRARIHWRIRDSLWGDSSYRPWWKFWEQGWWPW